VVNLTSGKRSKIGLNQPSIQIIVLVMSIRFFILSLQGRAAEIILILFPTALNYHEAWHLVVMTVRD